MRRGQIKRPAYIHIDLTVLALPSSFFHFDFLIFALVPTIDTTRASWILEQMVKIKRPVLLVGESGTSKTATIHNFLKNLNADTRVSLKSNHVYICYVT